MIAISATSNSRSRTTRLKNCAALPFTSTKLSLSVRVLNCLVTSWSPISVLSILLLVSKNCSDPFSILERKAGVLFGKRDLRVVRGLQVFELVFLRAPIELARAGKKMQQHGEVPADAHGSPDAAQRRAAISV